MNGTTAIIAGTSLIFAITAILSSRSTARKNNSLSLLMELKQDEKFYSTLRTIQDMVNKNDIRIDELAALNIEDQRQRESAQSIRYLLNLLESISIGIKHNIYDEASIKDSICSILTQAFDQTKPFIDRTRSMHGKDTYYMEFERLAKKWKKKPIKSESEKKWWQKFS
ncbi:MAG: DUF4760 domain-containing protein [Methylophagaceae bacterium]